MLARIVIDKTTNKTYFIDYKSQTISPTNPRLGPNQPVMPWYYTLDSHWDWVTNRAYFAGMNQEFILLMMSLKMEILNLEKMILEISIFIQKKLIV